MDNKEKIDAERCARAAKDIYVKGVPNTPQRLKVIADAIAAIQSDGGGALRDVSMGVKNYAGFGDQRCDCKYGYGPSHGYIVFEVGRRSERRESALGGDHVYLLECVRDFGSARIAAKIARVTRTNWNDPEMVDVNLTQLLQLVKQNNDEAEILSDLMAQATVESHESVAIQ